MATKYVWPLLASLVIAILGAAMIVWPFAVHAQVGGWTRGTIVDFWSGIGIAVIGLLAFASWYSGLKKELVQRGAIEVRRPEPEAPPTPATTPVNQEEDLDRLLRPLAETVLRDLTEQLAAKEGRTSGEGGIS